MQVPTEELIQKTVNTMEAIAADLNLNEPFVVNTSKISKYLLWTVQNESQ